MADDDDKPKKHTIESLFRIYCNHKVIGSDLENQEYHSILLSQLDCWLEQAKLMPVPITRTQTGLIYMRYKKWRLEYEDFLEVLQILCSESDLNYEEMKETLVLAGAPTGATEIVVVK
ncbi:hypothetical protein AWZ03_003283 [Drosophila navojoa]|uniref:TPPP family protein n=1 Tax=Drosophila navojoa TaxID=7232 RepID=A0A484BNQ4_DRONA|nr:uncharacterized protein LOC108651260 [Drosophila navojoa]TDG50378.1 hypothetical protein AWZ03_003283 [Drosophila navojoa]